jgi:Ca2+-binding EF-hand superfamily protein
MKTPMFLLIATLFISLSGLQAGGTGEKVFRKADKNGDGKVSEEEFIVLIPNDPEKATKRFKKIDHDNDGFASLEEIVAFYDKN